MASKFVLLSYGVATCIGALAYRWMASRSNATDERTHATSTERDNGATVPKAETVATATVKVTRARATANFARASATFTITRATATIPVYRAEATVPVSPPPSSDRETANAEAATALSMLRDMRNIDSDVN